MKTELVTEKKIVDKDGDLGLHVRLTLRLRSEGKADSEDILAALRQMANDQDSVVVELVRKYAMSE